MEPLRFDVKERGCPPFRAGEPHGAAGLEGRGPLVQIELDAVLGNNEKGGSRARFQTGQVGHARTLPEAALSPRLRSVQALAVSNGQRSRYPEAIVSSRAIRSAIGGWVAKRRDASWARNGLAIIM